jgi:hypothetical protein
MTGNLDRYGEPIDALEDDDPPPDTTTRTPGEIRAHADELRRILAESRARREAKP